MERYLITLAHRNHLADLPVIERAAASVFPPSALPTELREQTLPLEQLGEAQAMGRLWVAVDVEGQPVGFAMAATVDEAALLAEVDVHPRHQRQGLGRKLVEAVIDWARKQGAPQIVLTTFRELPWNGPFYAGIGFREMRESELSPGLAEKLREESRLGLTGRVAMQLALCDFMGDPKQVR